MSSPPAQPKIYHITHGQNLAGIVPAGFLWSDAEMIIRGGPKADVGLSEIKKRRREELDVTCHPGTKVGQFVPFYLAHIGFQGLHTGIRRNCFHSKHLHEVAETGDFPPLVSATQGFRVILAE